MGERELYRGILNQAFIDASNVEYREELLEFIGSEEFEIICQFAEVPFKRVKIEFEKYLK